MQLFQDVRGFAEDTLYPPLGIIAVAFELNKKSWLDRNVYGKLVAMSMALAKNTETATIDKINVFQSKYLAACSPAKPAHLDTETWHKVCRALGKPILKTNNWKSAWEREKNRSGAYASVSMELFLPRRENDSIYMKVCMRK